MMMLITYDVATESSAGRRRLRRIARLCQDYGQRVQYSVFECNVNPAQWAIFRARLIDEINEASDSLRFYRLGANWRPRVEHIGAKKAYDPDGPMVF